MAGEEITVDQLRQLLGVQADLRQQAENRWQKAQQILVSLLESFAPEEVERRLKTGQPLDSMKVDELGQLINQQINARIRKAQEVKNGSANGEELQTLKNQLLTIQGEMDRLRLENRHLAAEITQPTRGTGWIDQPACRTSTGCCFADAKTRSCSEWASSSGINSTDKCS